MIRLSPMICGVTPFMKTVKLTQGQFAQIDDEDFEYRKGVGLFRIYK